MLKYNTYRALRYLRSVFVEGTYLLASEATNLQLESLEISKEIVRKYIGDAAIQEGWKVEKLSDTEVLIKKGEAWVDGFPIVLRSDTDPLVSLGVDETGEATLVDWPGGKKLTFGPTTAADTYRIVITAKEEIVTSIQDNFLTNANLNEATAQKIRVKYLVNVVPEADQSETPVPYKNESSDYNLVNKVIVTSNAGGTGELLTTTTLSGSSIIDGRDLEIKIKNYTSTSPYNNVLPVSSVDQPEFTNGTLVDNNGEKFHINVMFNDTDSSVVVMRLDKQFGQANPVLANGSTFQVLKKSIFSASDVSGSPQGKLYWPIATVVWDSGIVHSSSVSDLRSVVSNLSDYQQKTNNKFSLRTTGGGQISYGVASDNVFVWAEDFVVVNPHGPSSSITASQAAVIEGGSLAYELDWVSGGPVEQGSLTVTTTSTGTLLTLSGSPDLSSVRVGNVVKLGTEIAHIVLIDNIGKTLEVSSAITTTGSLDIYLDSFGPELAPLTENTFILASVKGGKLWVGPTGQELEDGETANAGDGLASAILTYIGSTGESDTDPNYSSAQIVTQGGSLTQAIGELDQEVDDINQVLVRGVDVTLTGILDQNVEVTALGTGTVSIQGDSVDVEDINVQGNTITGGASSLLVQSDIDEDLSLQAQGTGSVLVESLTIKDNTITGDPSAILEIKSGTDQNLELDAQGTGVVVVKDRLSVDGYINTSSGTDTTFGSNAVLAAVVDGVVRLTNAALVSIDEIPAGVDGQKLTVINDTGAPITINNELGATPANQIITGLLAPVTIQDTASVELVYNTDLNRWLIVGGTGSGGAGSGSPLDPDPESNYLFYARSDFAVDKKLFYGAITGTAADDILGFGRIKFLTAGDKFTSLDLVGDEQKLEANIINQATAKVRYSVDYKDSAPVVKLTRDGGANWISATLTDPTVQGDTWLADVTWPTSEDLESGTSSVSVVTGQKVAIIIQPEYDQILTSVKLKLSTVAVTGTVTAKLYSVSAGLPNTLIATSSTSKLLGSEVTGTLLDHVFVFANRTLEEGTQYAIAVETSGVQQVSVAQATSPATWSLSSALDTGSGWTTSVSTLYAELITYGNDLQIEVESGSASEVRLLGFGVDFVLVGPATLSGVVGQEVRIITSAEASSGIINLNSLTYTPGTRQLHVKVSNHLLMGPEDFIELSPSQVQFSSGALLEGQVVVFYLAYGLVDGSSQSLSKLNALEELIVGSSAQVAAGVATHSSIQAAVSVASAGQRIALLKGVFTETLTIDREVHIYGRGRGSEIVGTITVSSTGSNCSIKNCRLSGNTTINALAKNVVISDNWVAPSYTVSGGTNAFILNLGEVV